VDFDPSEEQRAILESVEALLARHAGPRRAIELAAKGEYDTALDRALADAGFAEIARSDGAGPLEAALVVESIARAAGVVAAGAGMLVAPQVAGSALAGPVALARAGDAAPIRFGAHARTLLLLDGGEARALDLPPGTGEPVRSNFGFPAGRIDAAALRGGASLGRGSGERLAAWWRVALAAELVGCMRACLAVTVEYVSKRRQFGRPIGSFQGVQHRLAECAVLVEGSGWLAREAAWLGAPAEAAATAAAQASAAAARVFTDTHQFTGSMGFTREHDLHVWSMRLQALRLELGGVGAHRRAVAEARWTPGA
jgi:alkylation response protein AidB-like acyl-CoA dehydrogenase